MIFKISSLPRFFFTYICPRFYGPSAPPSNTTSSVTQNTIPPELMPYALGNLQAAKGQLFKTDASGAITGYQPYKPYSKDPNKYVAGFSALQKQAQQGAGKLAMPGQYKTATGMATSAGQGALGAGDEYNQMATDPGSMSQWMSPYMQNVTDYQTQQANRQYDISGAAQMGAASRSGAFGGSRDSIMAAENERNRNQGITGIQATGAQNAWQDARQAQQFGSTLGMQGYQTAIQGAQELGNLGDQQLAAQTSILNTKNQFGAEVQGRQQALMNQRIKNFENQQNQPYRAMDTMSGLIRGTPISQSATTSSVANPSYAQQIGGVLGAAGSLYGAYKGGKAEGGIVGYAGGGSVEYGIESKLRDMTPEQLQSYIPTITSQEELNIAKQILAEETMQMAADGGIMGYADEGYVRGYDYDFPAGSETHEENTLRRIKESAANRMDSLEKVKPNIKSSAKPNYVQKGIKPSKEKLAYQAKQLVDTGGPYESTIEPGKGLSTNAKSTIAKPSISGLTKLGGVGVDSQSVSDFASQMVDVPESQYHHPELKSKLLNMFPKPEGFKTHDWVNKIGNSLKKFALNPDWEPELDSAPSAQKAVVPTKIAQQPAPAALAQIGSPSPAPTGILGAAPQDKYLDQEIGVGSIGASAAKPAGDQTDYLSKLTSQFNEADKGDRETAAKSQVQIMEEENAKKAALGIKSPDQLSAEQKKSIMDERVNAQDENKRQMYLRMAEFFSNWGSTPGLPLVAGLKAMKDTLPGVMTDSKEHRVVMRDIDKSLRDLDYATNLEKSGHYDKASAIKEQASSRMLKHDEVIAGLGIAQQEKEKDRASEERRTGISAEASMYGSDNRYSGSSVENKEQQTKINLRNSIIQQLGLLVGAGKTSSGEAKILKQRLANIDAELGGGQGTVQPVSETIDPKRRSQADLIAEVN